MHQITVLLSLVVLSNRRGKTISTEISWTNSSSTSTTESPYCGTSTNWRTKNSSKKK
jgi:hypothetical protein